MAWLFLPGTLFCQPSVQIRNGTAAVFATLLNLPNQSSSGIHQSSMMVSSQTGKNALTAACLEPIFWTIMKMYRISFCTRPQ
jgi:hypothetical protein